MPCQPRTVLGAFQGHALYGIKSLAALGLQMATVVGPCNEAAQSPDARDKYFMTSVLSFDPSPAEALASEVPSLEVRRAAFIVGRAGACGVVRVPGSAGIVGRSRQRVS